MLSRRFLLRSTASAFAAASLPRSLFALAPEPSASAPRLSAGPALAPLPEDFTGLGYEMSSPARLGLLSTANQAYVNLVRGLGARGVMRFGGIVADFTRYKPDGPVRTEPKDTVVSRRSLEQVRGFLDATGWRAIWSVNFGRGTLPEAIAEARDVHALLGPRLLALELGNEVENYGGGRAPLRPAPYTYETWRAEYTRWHDALIAAIPGLRFAAPDTAASVEWVERLAADAHGDVQLLTTHYYRGGQQKGTQAQLLTADPTLEDTLSRLGRAARRSGLPWRMCETNSFFGGGRPGVSNTLAGALWTLDYMLRLAAAGCSGVNLETGVNQLGFISSYSPIQDDNAGGNTAGAPYYGMLAFAQAARNATEVLATALEPAPGELSAYLLGSGGKPGVAVLINRSPSQASSVNLAELRLGGARVLRLTGPALDSTTGVMLGGAAVDAEGHWSAAKAETASDVINIPPASAAVVAQPGHVDRIQ